MNDRKDEGVIELTVFRILAADFHCDELNSSYCQGLTYTLRPGNDRLAQRVKEWVATGRAEIVTAAVRSTMTGQGKAA